MPKTETLTIRISNLDKRLLADLAWVRRKSMADLIVELLYSAPEITTGPDYLPMISGVPQKEDQV